MNFFGVGTLGASPPTTRLFSMGDFFEVWGTENPYINSEVVSISLNGKRYNGDYRELILEDAQNVVIEFEN